MFLLASFSSHLTITTQTKLSVFVVFVTKTISMNSLLTLNGGVMHSITISEVSQVVKSTNVTTGTRISHNSLKKRLGTS